MGYYRLGFVPATGLYYISGDEQMNGISSSGQTVDTSSLTCDPTTNIPDVGPVFGGTTQIVGQTLSNVSLAYKVGPTYGANVTSSYGYGGISWCGQFNYQNSSFGINTTSGLETTVDKCTTFNYVSDVTSAINDWYCVYCPIGVAATSPPTTQSNSIRLNNFQADSAITIPTASYGLVWNDDGSLTKRSYCSTFSNAFTASPTITGSTTGSAMGQNGQKVIITFTLATTIKSVTSVVLEGRNFSAPSSVDSSFPQSTLDSYSEVWLVSTADTTVDQYIKLTGSTISGGSFTFPIGGVATSKTSRNAWQLIVWGLNGNTSTTNTTTSQYFAIKTIRGSLAEISISTVSPVSSSLIQWQFVSPITNFTVISPQYTRPILNSVGSFRWDFSFTTTRPWYYSDQVIFDLSAFSTTSQNSNATSVKCRITDTKDNVIQWFSSCSLTSPNLTIVAIQRGYLVAALATSLDFSASGIRVYMDGIRALSAQATQTINGRVVFGGYFGGSTVALTRSSTSNDIIASTDVSSKAFPSGYPTLSKLWVQASNDPILRFNLITSVQITTTGRITIEFPTYYNPGLTTASAYPFCTVADTVVNCVVVGPRSLQLTALPTSIGAGASFLVKLQGIRAPPSGSTTDNYWIQINTDNTDLASGVVYGGLLTDTSITASTIVPFHVNWLNVSTTNTRSSATFTWTFNQIGANDSDTNRSVHVQFPQSWGLSWGIFTPTCSVIDYANNTLVYSTSQSIFGDLIYLNLTSTLPANRIVNLVCSAVRTPDNETTYPSREITFQVVSQDGATIWQQSSPSVHNVNWNMAFTNNPNLQYVDWTGTISTFLAPIKITRGTYGPNGKAITFSIPSRSNQGLQFNLVPSIFVPSTSPLNIPVGQTGTSIFVGCASSTPLNRYGITLTVNASTIYQTPKPLWVNVTADPVPVTITPGTDVSVIVVSKATVKTQPVTFDTSMVPPFSDITITPKAPTNTNFTVSPTSITLTKANPWATFVWSTTANTLAGESQQWQFVVSGTDAASFATPTPFNVKGVQDTNNEGTSTPTLVINIDSSDTARATMKTLSFTLGKVSNANIYLGCQIDGTAFPTQDVFMRMAIADAPVNLTDPTRADYASFFMSSTSYIFTVTSLKPDHGYMCQAFASSATGINSTFASIRFRTASNGQTLTRYVLTFNSVLTRAYIQVLLCAYTQYFHYPAQNIVLQNGEYCGYSPNVAISTASFSAYVYPLEVESSSLSRVLQTTGSTSTNSGSTGTQNAGVVTTVSGANLASAAAITAINASLVAAGAPAMQNTSSAGPVSSNGVAYNTTPIVQTGTNWVQISNIVLSSNGWVYCGIAVPGASTPVGWQLQAAAQGNSSAVGSSFVQTQNVYYSSNGAVSLNFSSSINSNTTYNLYLVASNDDTSSLANFTSVSTYNAQTQVPGGTTISATTLFVSMIAAFAMMLFLVL